MSTDPTAVLFVCLGNICRSPLAEGVFRHLVSERGTAELYHIDSAGTGAWHVGEPPDRRSAEVARRHRVVLQGSARQISPEDLERFHWVIVMDRQNLAAVEALQRGHGGGANVRRLRDFDPDPGNGDVPDPYYGGPQGFDEVYALVHRSLEGLLEQLEDDSQGSQA